MIGLFTDGSFVNDDAATNSVHGGVWIVARQSSGDVVDGRYHFTCKNATYAKSRNISGELLAVVQGLKKVVETCEPDTILLTYDYEGIGKWVDGSWQTKKALTIGYVKMIADFQKKHPDYPILWKWVRGHANEAGNIGADEFATLRDEQVAKQNNVIWIDEDPKFC